MKVAFARRDKDPTIGPFIFLERLIEYFGTRDDIEVARRASKYHDIHLVNVQGSCRRADQYKAKKILRVDGIYFDASTNLAERNGPILDTYHSVDGIVFQSHFAQQMIHKHFGLSKCAKHEAVIYNGVSGQFKPLDIAPYDFGSTHSIVACAKWRPDKRLESMVKGFLASDRTDTTLNIFGEVLPDVQVKHPRIKYFGFVPPGDMWKYYCSADIMLHLAYIDWCPNSVIEGLRCGLRVITTHNGGVPELVRGSGAIIKSDPDYDMQPFDFSKMPQVNPQLVAEAINVLLDDPEPAREAREDLSIETCGAQYVEFFKKVRGDV